MTPKKIRRVNPSSQRSLLAVHGSAPAEAASPGRGGHRPHPAPPGGTPARGRRSFPGAGAGRRAARRGRELRDPRRHPRAPTDPGPGPGPVRGRGRDSGPPAPARGRRGCGERRGAAASRGRAAGDSWGGSPAPAARCGCPGGERRRLASPLRPRSA